MNPKICLALLLAPITCVAAQPLEIAVIPKSVQSEYWDLVHAGAEKAKPALAAEGVEVNVLWDGPQREDQVDLQKQVVSRCIERKVSAIVLAPVNAQALVPAVEQAKSAGIPVVVIDSLLASDSPVATVATNNYKAGLLAGRQMGEALGGKGKVAVLRFMKGHGSTQPRESGFLDAVKRFPGIQVVSADVYAGATSAEAQSNAGALLQKCGADLQGVFTSNLYATEGMLAALRATGAAGKIAFVGFDGTPAMFDALRKGELSAIAVQQPLQIGYLGVRAAVDAVRHKPVDKEIDTPVIIVTKDNLDSPQVQALVKPKA